MAMNVSLRQRKLEGAARLLTAVPTGEVMGDLIDTVSDRILIEHIRPNPNQPRQGVDEESQEFADLVGSIGQQGLIQPISLWQLADDEYMIIAGERRWRAFRRLAVDRPADFARIPATVTRLLGENPEAKALILGLIENVVRQDLRDGERADALSRLKSTTGWTYEQIANRMGLDVSRVQALASLAKHGAVKDAVNDGRLTQKQALAIGQGIPADDGELAAELVGAVQDLSPSEARSVVREARSLPNTFPTSERVRQARDSVLIESTRGPHSADTFDVRTRDDFTAQQENSVIELSATSLRVVRPRIHALERGDLAAMLQRVCEETNIWPEIPGRPRI
jgi:ParB family transcriptional regulator, chromosome partitioning protein